MENFSESRASAWTWARRLTPCSFSCNCIQNKVDPRNFLQTRRRHISIQKVLGILLRFVLLSIYRPGFLFRRVFPPGISTIVNSKRRVPADDSLSPYHPAPTGRAAPLHVRAPCPACCSQSLPTDADQSASSSRESVAPLCGCQGRWRHSSSWMRHMQAPSVAATPSSPLLTGGPHGSPSPATHTAGGLSDEWRHHADETFIIRRPPLWRQQVRLCISELSPAAPTSPTPPPDRASRN